LVTSTENYPIKESIRHVENLKFMKNLQKSNYYMSDVKTMENFRFTKNYSELLNRPLNKKRKIIIRIRSFDFFYIKKLIEKLQKTILYRMNRSLRNNYFISNYELYDIFGESKNTVSNRDEKGNPRNSKYKKKGGFLLPYHFLFTPIKIEKFTVERSPHIDKKSREQFQRKTFSCIISINFFNFLQQYTIIKILKETESSGNSIEIISQFFDFLE
jgi:hypothetical protein